ncbi:MAG TPA: hypothetical protein V6D29_16935, partial [Leptolyngbyaceae cyanobacterium]
TGYHTSSSNCDYPPIPDQDTNGDGKVGNTVTTQYKIKILSTGPGSPGSVQYKVNHLILDFSGGSYHYNSDYGDVAGGGGTIITIVNPQADLSLSKSHTGNFSTGNNTYTLAVTNNGPNIARGPITVVDTLPTGFSYVSASGTNWTCSASGQLVTCTSSNDMPVGSSTLNLTVNVSSSAASNSLNTATVSSSTTDPNTSNNKAADPTTVVQGPNLSLTKTHTPATFVVGKTGTYTLTVSNSSSFNASGPLTIVDTLPAGLTFGAASGTGWTCTANGQAVTCTNPNDLNAGQTSAVDLTVNIGSSVATPSITNTATVSSSSFDTNPADNTASDPTPTSKDVPDLIISKTDNGLNFAQGKNGTYTITVTNQGPAATTGAITVVDTLPSSFTFVSATSASGSSGWTCTAAAPTVTCINPNPLASGQSSAILLTVAPTTTTGSPFTNNVSVSTPGETKTDNNTASDSTAVQAVANNTVDLSVTKTVTTAPTGPNTPIQYQITITNNSNGNGSDAGITLTDLVPNSITSVSWTCNYVGADPTAVGNGGPSNLNSCNNGTAPHNISGTGNSISISTLSLRQGGGQVSIVISGTVGAVSGNIANTATVVPSGGTDKTPSDNVSTVTTFVPGADLKLAKTNFTNLITGVNGIYRLTVTNTSSAQKTVSPITVKDVLPSTLTYVSAASTPGSSGWVCSYDTTNRTVTCVTSDSLAANSSSSIDITVTPTASGSVQNNASVSMPGDNNASNNTAQVTTTVAAANPNLSITKATSGNFALGQEGTYVLTVSNVGTTVAVAPLTVTDTLPNGLSFLSGSGAGWVCSAAGQAVTCTNYSNLAAGSSTSLNLKVLVGSSTAASISNTAMVAVIPGETITANNTSNTLTTAIAQQADLAIAKVLSGSLLTGQQSIYTLTVTNNGPSSIPSGTAITVTDTLPSGLSFVSGSGNGFTCNAGSPVTCSKTNGLAVGEQAAIALTVSVSASSGPSLTNKAQVASSIADANTSNNSASRTDSVQAATVGLSLTKSHFGSFPIAGQGTYTLQVKNTGNVAITNTIKLVDALPTNLTLVSTVGLGWSCTGTSTVTCTTDDDLAAGATNAIDLVVKVGTGTPVGTNSITNTANAFIGTSNTPSATSTDPTTIVASADLSLTKTAATAFTVGQQAQYTLIVTNAASSTGSASAPITLQDQLPTGLTYVSGTGTGWTCPTAPAGSDITCTLGSALVVGSQSTLTVTVRVESTLVSPFTNSATAYSPTSDPNLLNNIASVTNSTSGGTASNPKLLLVKRITAINQTTFTTVVDGNSNPSDPNYVASPQDQDDNDPDWPSGFLKGTIHQTIKPGDDLEFTMYFLSTGNVPAQNVLFCDLVPSNVTFSKAGFNTVPAANGPSPVPGTTQAGNDRGIVLSMGTQSTTSPYPILASLSNTSDTDAGRYVEPGVNLTNLDARLSSCGNNTNGAIVVNLGTLPNATSAGNPAGSYGFVRFKGLVN